MTADVALFSILAYLLFSSAHKNFYTLAPDSEVSADELVLVA